MLYPLLFLTCTAHTSGASLAQRWPAIFDTMHCKSHCRDASAFTRPHSAGIVQDVPSLTLLSQGLAKGNPHCSGTGVLLWMTVLAGALRIGWHRTQALLQCLIF